MNGPMVFKPPVDRAVIRNESVPLCQAPSCSAELPLEWQDRQAWISIDYAMPTSGQYRLQFCRWGHLAEWATAMGARAGVRAMDQLDDPGDHPDELRPTPGTM